MRLVHTPSRPSKWPTKHVCRFLLAVESGLFQGPLQDCCEGEFRQKGLIGRSTLVGEAPRFLNTTIVGSSLSIVKHLPLRGLMNRKSTLSVRSPPNEVLSFPQPASHPAVPTSLRIPKQAHAAQEQQLALAAWPVAHLGIDAQNAAPFQLSWCVCNRATSEQKEHANISLKEASYGRSF